MFGTVTIPGFVLGRRATDLIGGAQSQRTLPVAAAYWQARRLHAYSGTNHYAPRVAIARGARGQSDTNSTGRARFGILLQFASESSCGTRQFPI